MTEHKCGADYAAPRERSIGSEPAENWPFGYTFSSPKTPRERAIPDARVNEVYDVLTEWLDDHALRTSVSSADLVDECHCSQFQIGRALSALADDEQCPIELELWSAEGGNGRARYIIQRSTGDADE